MSGGLRAGDWVEVRSKEEILRTLDGQGQLEALPFMPEMFQHCGQRFQVFKRAHKTCDPPSGLQARRMDGAVHLTDVRCDGSAHGGCEAGCLIFWKETWLKKVGEAESTSPRAPEPPSGSRASDGDVVAATCQSDGPGGEPIYVCQSTRLHAATAPLRWWDLRQYVEDLTSRNVRLSQMLAAALFFLYQSLAEAGLGLGAALRWAYDVFQKIRGGTSYPLRPGGIPNGQRTPSAKLNLRPGELVRVRSYGEILETLNQDWHNRGMYFDSEQVPFCNGTYRVLRRVEKLIDERTGKLVRLKNDAMILDGVVCEARYAKCRRFCSRAIYPYWREIWLERVENSAPVDADVATAVTCGSRGGET
jgi:hypothetical protein